MKRFPAALFLAALWLPAQENSPLRVLPVQGSVYLLYGPVSNATIQVGKDGVLLVDTMSDALAPQITAEIKKLSSLPVRYIIDTSLTADHIGGNAALQKAGAPGASVPDGGGATLIAHQNVLNHLTQPVTGNQTPPAQAGLPNDEYDTPTKDFYFNGEPVIVFHEPKAHTDGDSIVLFRRSDVISVGDIFTPDRYPEIDLEHGGSVTGLIAALNHLLHLTVPEHLQDGGTRVIPGHGRLCNEADVVEYRDMVTIVRDRVLDSVKKGKTLEEVKAAKLTRDYDTQYGPGDRFVEVVYKSLSTK
ncbi:MAG: MBL fold metallo-hydrolase [Acidobacteriia bacterium]|nr:MBL fold metallo-hydrolase [Terriglobia bacterium]